MKSRPWVQIPIAQILDETERGLKILTRAGRRPWLPKDDIDYIPGAVLVPEWLAHRILQSPITHEA
jgi:hypothetical protein